jgi:hypothetical protein
MGPVSRSLQTLARRSIVVQVPRPPADAAADVGNEESAARPGIGSGCGQVSAAGPAAVEAGRQRSREAEAREDVERRGVEHPELGGGAGVMNHREDPTVLGVAGLGVTDEAWLRWDGRKDITTCDHAALRLEADDCGARQRRDCLSRA